jgi:hypothetical protein
MSAYWTSFPFWREPASIGFVVSGVGLAVWCLQLVDRRRP